MPVPRNSVATAYCAAPGPPPPDAPGCRPRLPPPARRLPGGFLPPWAGQRRVDATQKRGAPFRVPNHDTLRAGKWVQVAQGESGIQILAERRTIAWYAICKWYPVNGGGGEGVFSGSNKKKNALDSIESDALFRPQTLFSGTPSASNTVSACSNPFPPRSFTTPRADLKDCQSE